MTLEALGWDDAWARALDGRGVPARVVRVDVDSCLVSDGDGERRVDATPLPAVGDWVVLDDDGRRRVVDVLPRRSSLVRADARRRQVLAANVDVVFVVTPVDAEDALDRLEREAALALASGARPVIVLTKSDLVPDDAAVVDGVRERLPALDVLVTSATSGEGIDALAVELRPRATGVLLGRSGGGKSSLTNVLLGTDAIATREVRADGEGRHTTTSRRLWLLPSGGALIDIPGLRSLGLAAAEEGVEKLYADIEALAATCRFADCSHDPGTPGCAVDDTIASGALSRHRVDRWKLLRDEVDRHAAVAARAPRRSGRRPRR